jgi:hypothetical protein
LFFGFLLGLVLLLRGGDLPGQVVAADLSLVWLPLIWIALYGCGLHAAGFFMPRGMKIFGWALVLSSAAFCASGLPDWAPRWRLGHALMGLFFGAAHLAYGVYLYFTESHGKTT